MSTEITRAVNVTDLSAVADSYARQNVLEDHMARRSEQTIDAYEDDIASFIEYLRSFHYGGACSFADSLEDWAGITWGIVEGFVKWLTREGYSISSINRKLSTIKVYTKLAHRAGYIDSEAHSLIATVRGYKGKEARAIDKRRAVTRVSTKKAENVKLTLADANCMKSQPDTPQGRRDAVVMCLLLDHGLRVSEVSALEVKDVQLDDGLLTFYRQKVDKTSRHTLTPATRGALLAYMNQDAPTSPAARLIRKSNRSGELTTPGVSVRSINRLVTAIGVDCGVNGVTPHDCRHYWATRAVKQGTDTFALKQAGGWTSIATVGRYVDESRIDNDNVKL